MVNFTGGRFWRGGVELSATVVISSFLALAVIKTLQWPMISDAVLIRYAGFLLQHGLVPYRELVDINLPGSYFVDFLVTKIFGVSALAWRLFDLTLMAISGGAMVFLAVRSGGSWFAGVFAGTLFALLHLSDGVAQMGQRDLVAAVILLCGAVNLVGGQSRYVRLRLLIFGLCCGLAATIKPQAIVFLLVALPYVIPELRRTKTAIAALLAILGGTAFPLAILGYWLWRQQALAAFVDTAQGLMEYHAGMARHSGRFLLAHAVPPAVLPLLAAAVIIVFIHGDWRRREQQAASLGVVCGFVSFFLQGKAYPYHRYPLLAFLFALVALELGPALRSAFSERGRLVERGLLALALGYGFLWLAPASVAKTLRYDWRSQSSLVQLQADLGEIGTRKSTGKLDGRVQCLDTMAGCITVLDRMQLAQTTGFLYDCYFFAPGESPVREDQRRRFIEQVMQSPPRVFIVTDQWCLNLPSGYEKLRQWPELSGYLEAHYTVTSERFATVVPGEDRRRLATWPFGYRIYEWSGSN